MTPTEGGEGSQLHTGSRNRKKRFERTLSLTMSMNKWVQYIPAIRFKHQHRCCLERHIACAPVSTTTSNTLDMGLCPTLETCAGTLEWTLQIFQQINPYRRSALVFITAQLTGHTCAEHVQAECDQEKVAYPHRDCSGYRVVLVVCLSE